MTHPHLAFVGTYDEEAVTEEVYTYRIDPDRGSFDRIHGVAVGENPFYQAIHPGKRVLYSVNFVDDGIVRSYSIDEGTGTLRELNTAATGGQGPCHMSIDSTGSWLLVANYDGGSVALLPIRDDGRVDSLVDLVEHEGSSVDPDRQTGPFPHSITFGPEDEYAYAADLGADDVLVYDVDPDRGELREVESHAMQPGAGPRHIAFHPNEPFVYVINELDSTITAFRRTPASGSLEALTTISTLPDGFDGENYAADIHVHPSGDWLYGSNRGHDSIAVFDLTGDGGRPTPVDREPSRGAWPWNLSLTPDGTRLYAANRDSDALACFRIDADDGTLDPIGQPATVGSPVCITPLDLEAG